MPNSIPGNGMPRMPSTPPNAITSGNTTGKNPDRRRARETRPTIRPPAWRRHDPGPSRGYMKPPAKPPVRPSPVWAKAGVVIMRSVAKRMIAFHASCDCEEAGGCTLRGPARMAATAAPRTRSISASGSGGTAIAAPGDVLIRAHQRQLVRIELTGYALRYIHHGKRNAMFCRGIHKATDVYGCRRTAAANNPGPARRRASGHPAAKTCGARQPGTVDGVKSYIV